MKVGQGPNWGCRAKKQMDPYSQQNSGHLPGLQQVMEQHENFSLLALEQNYGDLFTKWFTYPTSVFC
jgi:hypothetical protein